MTTKREVGNGAYTLHAANNNRDQDIRPKNPEWKFDSANPLVSLKESVRFARDQNPGAVIKADSPFQEDT